MSLQSLSSNSNSRFHSKDCCYDWCVVQAPNQQHPFELALSLWDKDGALAIELHHPFRQEETI